MCRRKLAEATASLLRRAASGTTTTGGARAERARLEAAEEREAAAEGTYDWCVKFALPHRRDVVELQDHLAPEDLDVPRRWRYLTIGVLIQARSSRRPFWSALPRGRRSGSRSIPRICLARRSISSLRWAEPAHAGGRSVEDGVAEEPSRQLIFGYPPVARTAARRADAGTGSPRDGVW